MLQVPTSVMVIDDSPTACFVIGCVFARAWIPVETYVRPLPALKELWDPTRLPPVALILDVELPQLDGYQIAQLIRAKAPPNVRRLPIVGLSARDGALDRVKAHLVGMNAYLTKPFDPAELVDLVETCRKKSLAQAC